MIWTRRRGGAVRAIWFMHRLCTPARRALLADRPFPFGTKYQLLAGEIWCATSEAIFPRWLFGLARHGSEGTFRDDGCLFLEASQAAKPS